MSMSRLCKVIAAILIATPTAAGAQISVGVSAGPAFTTLTGDDVNESAESRTGFFVGGSVHLALDDVIGFGTGAYFVQKGADFDLEQGQVALEIDYLEVPLLIHFQVTGADRPVGVSLGVGPAFGFNLSCDLNDTDDESSESVDCSEGEEILGIDDVRSFDLGLLVGGGLSFAASETTSFFVDGAFELGITSIADELEGLDEVDVRNRTWFFGAGVSWIVGG